MGVGKECKRYLISVIMKRFAIFLILSLLAIPTAEAKRRETPEEIVGSRV